MQEFRNTCRLGTLFGNVGAIAGDDHDRSPGPSGSDLLGHFQSAHAGHADVAVDEVVFFLVQLAQRFFTVFGGDDGVTLAGENTIKALADGGIVVDNEHAA